MKITNNNNNNNNNFIDVFTKHIDATLKSETDKIILSLIDHLLFKAKSIGNRNDCKFISSINVSKFKTVDEFVKYIRPKISFTYEDHLIYACLGAKVWFLLDDEYWYSYTLQKNP